MRGVLAFTGLLWLACTGEVLKAPEPLALPGVIRPGPGPGVQPAPGEPDVPEPPPPPYVPPAASLRALTASQYAASLAFVAGRPAAATLALPTSSLAAARTAFSDALVEAAEAAALSTARALVSDAAWTTAHVPCALAAVDCRRTVLRELGERAFRRPLSAEELADYGALFDAEAARFASPLRGLEFTLAALLQSPLFLYRVELTGPQDALDGPALASRMAYLLTDGPPDGALRAAAAQGALHDPLVRLQHAQRLLATPQGAKGARRFFEDWLQLDKVSTLEKVPTHFPLFSTQVAQAMREQAARKTEQLATSGADLRALFDDTGAELNAALAPLYGKTVLPAEGWVRFDKGQVGARPGLLGLPALLSLHAKPTKTSVTERGVFLRRDLLCGGVPLPPDVVPLLPTPRPGEQLTTRQLYERHRQVEPCKSCHTLFDPMGITLETFDGIGVARTHENGLPIDPSGELDGAPVADPAELAAALRRHPDTMRCLVERLHGYAAGHQAGANDLGWLKPLQGAFAAEGYTWRALLLAYVSSLEFPQAQEAR